MSLFVQRLGYSQSAVDFRVAAVVVGVVVVVVLVLFASSRIAKLSSLVISPRSTCTGGKLW